MSTALPRPALVAYVAAISSVCVAVLVLAPPAATGITAGQVGTSQLVSPQTLFRLRLFMLAANVISHLTKLVKTEFKEVAHNPESKLAPRVNIKLSGAVWLTFFTVQSWGLQTFYLLGASACSAVHLGVVSLPIPTALPPALWYAYEVSFAVAILVSFLVKYVIIPTTLSNGLPVENFFTFPDQMMHNCNVLFMAIELLTNDLPIELLHFPLACLWGLAYVLFSWWWMRRSGVCWYDFLDPTLPKACVIHTVLVLVLGVFFAFGAGLARGAGALSPTLRVGLVLLGVASVSRTRLTGIPQPAPTPAATDAVGADERPKKA